MTRNILTIDNLGLDFSERGARQVVLRNLTLSQKEGEWLALVGPNGAGKTSLALAIKGLIKPDRGSIRMFSDSPEEDLRLRLAKVGLLFANPRDQICSLTVRDDIAFGLSYLGLSRMEIRDRVEKAMETLGIGHLAYRMTNCISGGELQKAALAGLIALRPEYLILDEPATFLCPGERRELLWLLKAFHRSGTSILCVSTSWEEILMAERVAVLLQGRIAGTFTPQRLLEEEGICESTGLCPPDMNSLALTLNGYGLRLPDGIARVDEMASTLEKQWKEGYKGGP